MIILLNQTESEHTATGLINLQSPQTLRCSGQTSRHVWMSNLVALHQDHARHHSWYQCQPHSACAQR